MTNILCVSIWWLNQQTCCFADADIIEYCAPTSLTMLQKSSVCILREMCLTFTFFDDTKMHYHASITALHAAGKYANITSNVAMHIKEILWAHQRVMADVDQLFERSLRTMEFISMCHIMLLFGFCDGQSAN